MPHEVIEATEQWQIEASDELLAFAYTKEGIPYDDSSPWLANGQATRLLVMRGATIAGSIDVIRTGPLPLPLAKCYPRQLLDLQPSAEVGRFATNSLRLSEMGDLLREVSRRLWGLPGDVAVVGIHPDRAGLYRAYLGCVEVGPRRLLPGSSVPVTLLTLTREGFAKSVLGRRRV